MPKFTARTFRRACQCGGRCECFVNIHAEIDALYAMVDAFAVEMKTKLKQKYLDGYDGWDDPAARQYFINTIQERVTKEKQEVAIANFAAMLWNLED